MSIAIVGAMVRAIYSDHARNGRFLLKVDSKCKPNAVRIAARMSPPVTVPRNDGTESAIMLPIRSASIAIATNPTHAKPSAVTRNRCAITNEVASAITPAMPMHAARPISPNKK